MKTLSGSQYYFKQVTEFSLQNKVLDPPTSTIHLSLTRDEVLVPFTCKSQFCTKVRYSIMKTLRDRHFSLKQQTQFTMIHKVLDTLASNINDFFRRATVFLHSLERGYFAQSSCSSPMKTLRGRQDSFEKLTQFTMVNKVLTLLLQTLKILLQELQ
jgi:hypothetical protein